MCLYSNTVELIRKLVKLYYAPLSMLKGKEINDFKRLAKDFAFVPIHFCADSPFGLEVRVVHGPPS